MNGTSSRVGAIIVAAGGSQRMGGIDKVFPPLGGRPLLTWAVDTCQKCELLHQIVIVLNEKNLELGRKLAIERNWSKVIEVCPGGKRRQDSVGEGLKRLKDCDWVVIHDGARPFLTADLIRRGLEAAEKTGAAIAAVPVKDTVKLVNEDSLIKETLQRDRLWVAQTPQIFRFDIIARAYQEVAEEVTDDASLVERLGFRVRLFMGAYNNVKVTTPEDLALAEIIAKGEGENASRHWLRCSSVGSGA